MGRFGLHWSTSVGGSWPSSPASPSAGRTIRRPAASPASAYETAPEDTVGEQASPNRSDVINLASPNRSDVIDLAANEADDTAHDEDGTAQDEVGQGPAHGDGDDVEGTPRTTRIANAADHDRDNFDSDDDDDGGVDMAAVPQRDLEDLVRRARKLLASSEAGAEAAETEVVQAIAKADRKQAVLARKRAALKRADRQVRGHQDALARLEVSSPNGPSTIRK